MPRLRFTLPLLCVAIIWLGTIVPGAHTPIVIEVTKVVATPPPPPEPAPVERKATVGQVKIVAFSWSGGGYWSSPRVSEAGRLVEQGWSVLAISSNSNGASIALQAPPR
jgi:hypothetical protein